MSTRFRVLLATVFLVGCAGIRDQPTSSGDSSIDESAANPSIEGQPPAGGNELTGRLGTESIEGGCPYLETGDGTRYEVLYPQGWTVDRATATLRDPSGAVVATAGELVTVRGHETQDMVSICQIGPIFQATEVVTGT